MPDRLLDDVVEDVLRHARIVEAPPTVLAQRRGIEHRIGQLETKEPAIGDVHLDLAHQLTLRANPEQIADEQRLEHQGRIERRTTVVRTIEPGNPIVNEGKVDHRFDLAKKVIWRNQTLEADHLKFGLLRAGFLQHDPLNQKPLANARGLSAVWRPGFDRAVLHLWGAEWFDVTQLAALS